MPRPTTIITTATSPMTELMDDHRRCLIRIAELETALRPFVDAVYNDNGDVTIIYPGIGDYMRAKRILRQE